MLCFFFMRRPPPRSPRSVTLFPYSPLFRSARRALRRAQGDRRQLTDAPGRRAPASGGGDRDRVGDRRRRLLAARRGHHRGCRSEEHTSELQSLMRISYAVFCLKKKTANKNNITDQI